MVDYLEEIKSIVKCSSSFLVEDYKEPNLKLITLLSDKWNAGITVPEEDIQDFLDAIPTEDFAVRNPVYWLWKAAVNSGSNVSFIEVEIDDTVKVLLCCKISVYTLMISSSRERMKAMVKEALSILGE